MFNGTTDIALFGFCADCMRGHWNDSPVVFRGAANELFNQTAYAQFSRRSPLTAAWLCRVACNFSCPMQCEPQHKPHVCFLHVIFPPHIRIRLPGEIWRQAYAGGRSSVLELLLRRWWGGSYGWIHRVVLWHMCVCLVFDRTVL